jgi:hypothetical protein
MSNLMAPGPARHAKEHEVTHEEVVKRAYEIWEKRVINKEPGDAQQDWFQALDELLEKHPKKV